MNAEQYKEEVGGDDTRNEKLTIHSGRVTDNLYVRIIFYDINFFFARFTHAHFFHYKLDIRNVGFFNTVLHLTFFNTILLLKSLSISYA